MTRGKKAENTSIAQVLPGILRDKGWEKQLDIHSTFLRWQEIVGEEINEHARPLKITNEVLWLEVDNSSWLQQFQFIKLELLESLNQFLKMTRLKDIKMVLGKGETRGFGRQETVAVSFVSPNQENIIAFEKQVECIADEKCREALMQFWYLAQACERKTK